MKSIIICILMSLLMCDSAQAQTERIWADGTKDIGRASIVDMRLREGEGFYVATENGLYQSRDFKSEWSSVFLLPKGGTNEIRCFDVQQEVVYIGTRQGLYRATGYDGDWKRVFNALFPSRKDITCIAVSHVNPENVVIGTEDGLFASTNRGQSWRRLAHGSIHRVFIDEKKIYIVRNGSLYAADGWSAQWEKLFFAGYHTGEEDGAQTHEDAALEKDETNDEGISCFSVKEGVVYVAKKRGIFYSRGAAKRGTANDWIALSKEGIDGTISDILIADGRKELFTATTQGVYEYDHTLKRWEELTAGIRPLQVTRIRFSPETDETLLAATGKGLYRLKSIALAKRVNEDVEKKKSDTLRILDNEPTFIELRQAAIAYNEVSPEKIRSFRSASRIKALLPKVSFGLGRRQSSNIEIYKSSAKNYVIAGPDDVSRDWDVSLTWELSDLIYSADQTSIDVRSRLMVQLRNDILDDLRRSYYQRKRLMMEMALHPRSSEDPALRLEKELRLQELTAAIDDLTGNYLSKKTHLRSGGE